MECENLDKAIDQNDVKVLSVIFINNNDSFGLSNFTIGQEYKVYLIINSRGEFKNNVNITKYINNYEEITSIRTKDNLGTHRIFNLNEFELRFNIKSIIRNYRMGKILKKVSKNGM